jgi:phosphoadenosine phosphosulfate reductase
MIDIEYYSEQLESKNAEEVLLWASVNLQEKVTFASSMGAEDQVILDMISRLELDIPVFTLDTGRIFNETYELIAASEKKYGKKIRVFSPKSENVEKMVSEHGVNLFFQSVELRKECCRVRKLEPLARALKPYSAWICGLRREQAVTRSDTGVIELDANGRIKINPLVNWSEQDVWDYIHKYDVPYNKLHDQGFLSIGCASCTRAVAPGEHTRAGRWWWETPEQKECGLHFKNGKLVRAKNKDI